MKDELPSKTSDRSLDERFQSRPHVYARLQRIADMMDQAIAEGATADEAEELAIEQIRKLGQDVMGDWAQEKHRQSLQRARADHPQATKHAKKK
jgi:division protein CdvB (Snf7/Vps24/ESCRT-III family)